MNTKISKNKTKTKQKQNKNKKNQMDELLNHGEALHQNIIDSGNILKRARGKIDDIMGSLGLSDSLMSMIDKRQTQDKYLLGVGIIVCLIIMWATVHYFT